MRLLPKQYRYRLSRSWHRLIRSGSGYRRGAGTTCPASAALGHRSRRRRRTHQKTEAGVGCVLTFAFILVHGSAPILTLDQRSLFPVRSENVELVGSLALVAGDEDDFLAVRRKLRESIEAAIAGDLLQSSPVQVDRVQFEIVAVTVMLVR